MDESASQVLAESAPPEEMQTLLNQLIAKNRALQHKLDSRGSSPAGTATPKPANPSPAEAADKAPPTVDEDEDEDAEDDDADQRDGSGNEEDEDEEEDEEAEPSSVITPPPKTNRAETPTPPAPEAPPNPFAHANSTTHRAEWMAFGRRMDGGDASTKFPELMGLWSASRDDKLKAFREWLSKDKNYEQAESHMTFLREKEFKGNREWECLTILEMVQRNFSTHGPERFLHDRTYGFLFRADACAIST
ncbi:unnamed protein product [Symbiodinium sp. CCMP2456]|nr:unnamed protein product [Symbiodinium sp. CCMP2456]